MKSKKNKHYKPSDYSKVISKIKLIENNFKDNDLFYRNINIIPLIRSLFFYNYQKKTSSPSKIFKLKIFLLKLINLFKLPFYYLKKKEMFNKIENIKKKDLIFFSNHNFYYDELSNKKVNLFIDPYYEVLKKKYKSLKVEIISNNFEEITRKNEIEKKYKPFYLKLFYLDIFSHIKRSLGFFIDLQNNNRNMSYLKHHLKLKDVEFIKKETDQIIFDSNLLVKFIKKVNPKIVFLTCYYSRINFSIILACKTLNIPVVDIQHGGQDSFHLMYSNWSKIPKKGHLLLPNYFWLWGNSQKNDGAFNSPLSNHKYIVGGKTQINFWEKNKKAFDKKNLNTLKFFLNKKKKYKKVILFAATFQIPDIIIKLIKLSPKNWLWLIRPHPRHTDLQKIKLTFRDNDIFNVDFEFASKVNLNSVLNNITHFITEVSSTFYDSLYFNVPSIVLQKDNNLFKKKIQSGNLKFSLNKDEIIRFIMKKKITKDKNKILSKPIYALNAVKKIISKIN